MARGRAVEAGFGTVVGLFTGTDDSVQRATGSIYWQFNYRTKQQQSEDLNAIFRLFGSFGQADLSAEMVILGFAVLGLESQGTSYSNTEGLGVGLVQLLGVVENEASMANSDSTCGAIIISCSMDR